MSSAPGTVAAAVNCCFGLSWDPERKGTEEEGKGKRELAHKSNTSTFRLLQN